MRYYTIFKWKFPNFPNPLRSLFFIFRFCSALCNVSASIHFTVSLNSFYIKMNWIKVILFRLSIFVFELWMKLGNFTNFIFMTPDFHKLRIDWLQVNLCTRKYRPISVCNSLTIPTFVKLSALFYFSIRYVLIFLRVYEQSSLILLNFIPSNLRVQEISTRIDIFMISMITTREECA